MLVGLQPLLGAREQPSGLVQHRAMLVQRLVGEAELVAHLPDAAGASVHRFRKGLRGVGQLHPHPGCHVGHEVDVGRYLDVELLQVHHRGRDVANIEWFGGGDMASLHHHLVGYGHAVGEGLEPELELLKLIRRLDEGRANLDDLVDDALQAQRYRAERWEHRHQRLLEAAQPATSAARAVAQPLESLCERPNATREVAPSAAPCPAGRQRRSRPALAGMWCPGPARWYLWPAQTW